MYLCFWNNDCLQCGKPVHVGAFNSPAFGVIWLSSGVFDDCPCVAYRALHS